MSRARSTHLAFVLLAASAAGFVIGMDSFVSFDGHVSAEQTPNVHLTHSQPRAVVAVPEAVRRHTPSLLLLPVTQIDNETLTPVSVYAYLTWSDPTGDRPARLLLGQVSLFPANQPGTFTIRLSQEFQNLLERPPAFPDSSPSLELELRPIQSQTLPPMDLTIGPIEWRTAADGEPIANVPE